MLCQLTGLHTQSRNINKEYTPKIQLKPTTKQKYTTDKLVSITFLLRERASHLFKIIRHISALQGKPYNLPTGPILSEFLFSIGRKQKSFISLDQSCWNQWDNQHRQDLAGVGPSVTCPRWSYIWHASLLTNVFHEIKIIRIHIWGSPAFFVCFSPYLHQWKPD